MDIKEAIQHCREVAAGANKQGECLECAEDHRQLADWLTELLSYKATGLDPSELPEGMEPGDYMRLCLAMLETADIVHFLDDWEKSPGARLEMAWCRYVGKVYIVNEKKGTSSGGEGKEVGDG